MRSYVWGMAFGVAGVAAGMSGLPDVVQLASGTIALLCAVGGVRAYVNERAQKRQRKADKAADAIQESRENTAGHQKTHRELVEIKETLISAQAAVGPTGPVGVPLKNVIDTLLSATQQAIAALTTLQGHAGPPGPTGEISASSRGESRASAILTAGPTDPPGPPPTNVQLAGVMRGPSGRLLNAHLTLRFPEAIPLLEEIAKDPPRTPEAVDATVKQLKRYEIGTIEELCQEARSLADRIDSFLKKRQDEIVWPSDPSNIHIYQAIAPHYGMLPPLTWAEREISDAYWKEFGEEVRNLRNRLAVVGYEDYHLNQAYDHCPQLSGYTEIYKVINGFRAVADKLEAN